jgi:hypothetical protein
MLIVFSLLCLLFLASGMQYTMQLMNILVKYQHSVAACHVAVSATRYQSTLLCTDNIPHDMHVRVICEHTSCMLEYASSVALIT